MTEEIFTSLLYNVDEADYNADESLDIFLLPFETNGRQSHQSDTFSGGGSQKYILQCQRWVRRQVDIVATLLPHPVKKSQIQEMIQLICKRRGRWMTGRNPKRLRAFIAACVYISMCQDGDMPIIEEYAHAAGMKKHVFRRYVTIAHRFLSSAADDKSETTSKQYEKSNIYLPPLCIEGVVASLKDLIRRYLTFTRHKLKTESHQSLSKLLNKSLLDKSLLDKSLLDNSLLALTEVEQISDTPSTVASLSSGCQSPSFFPQDSTADLFPVDWQIDPEVESGEASSSLLLDDLFKEDSRADMITVVDLNDRDESINEKILRERWEELTEKILRRIGIDGFITSRDDRKNMAMESGQILLVSGKLMTNKNSIISLKWMSEFLNVNKSVLSSGSVLLGQRLVQLAVDKGVIGKVVASAIGSTEIKGLKGRARWAILNMVDL